MKRIKHEINIDDKKIQLLIDIYFKQNNKAAFMKEKINTYLKSCHVTEHHVDSIEIKEYDDAINYILNFIEG